MSRYKLKLHLRNAVPEIIALVNNDKDVYFVQVVLGGAQEMYPAAITQKEKQLTRYKFNLHTDV